MAPQTPQETARGREFRFSPPLDSPSQRPKRGHRNGPSLETPLSWSSVKNLTPTAYFVTPRGFVCFASNVLCSCPQDPKGKGTARLPLYPAQAAGISIDGLKVTMSLAAAAQEGARVTLTGPPGNIGRNHRVFIRGIPQQDWSFLRLYRSSLYLPLVLCP